MQAMQPSSKLLDLKVFITILLAGPSVHQALVRNKQLVLACPKRLQQSSYAGADVAIDDLIYDQISSFPRTCYAIANPHCYLTQQLKL
jgi:hypothetical protein